VPPENSIGTDSDVHRRLDCASKIRRQTRASVADREVGHGESGKRGEARTSLVQFKNGLDV
jgi:hypothetical protein